MNGPGCCLGPGAGEEPACNSFPLSSDLVAGSIHKSNNAVVQSQPASPLATPQRPDTLHSLGALEHAMHSKWLAKKQNQL